MFRRFAMHVVTAAVAGLSFASNAHAVYWWDSPASTSLASVVVNYGQGVESGTESSTRRSAVGGGVTASEAVGPLAAEAYAKADPGQLMASASTRFDSSWRDGASWYYDRTVAAQSSATWVDHVTITGGTGLGIGEFVSVVEGRMDGGSEWIGLGSSGSVNFRATYEVLDCYWWYECSPADVDQTLATVDRSVGPLNRLGMRDDMSRAFSFEYGQTFQLRVTLSTSGFEGGDSDFASTATFGLVLPEGAVLRSAMGFDYGAAAAPVPEPATYAMTAAGLVLLAMTRRAATARRCRHR